MRVADRSVLRLLHLAGYTMQQNVKTREGADHPDRDPQFQYINDASARAITACEPVISVDTKHLGAGRRVQERWAGVGALGGACGGQHARLPQPRQGQGDPLRGYDLARNEGWVSVGISRDTASFAVNSIGSWWERLGKPAYPHARSLTITADSGGSNSARGRLWKLELHKLADRTGLEIVVCHFPRGTSKWNKTSIACSASSATTGAASR